MGKGLSHHGDGEYSKLMGEVWDRGVWAVPKRQRRVMVFYLFGNLHHLRLSISLY